ncbi:hypothetical protein MKS88_003120 [Plasmodium brasilianum]|uniref:Uncharacterized protein n=1 Tax=Plasmodium brasilianum TaxID=5824 RepID=A0ACB9Y927_PLABR|nr:hypothetical protein MKS88_003120 [Plasmodium brasilianum]
MLHFNLQMVKNFYDVNYLQQNNHPFVSFINNSSNSSNSCNRSIFLHLHALSHVLKILNIQKNEKRKMGCTCTTSSHSHLNDTMSMIFLPPYVISKNDYVRSRRLDISTGKSKLLKGGGLKILWSLDRVGSNPTSCNEMKLKTIELPYEQVQMNTSSNAVVPTQ